MIGRYGKKAPSDDFGARGSALRKQAIDSFQNIANVTIGQNQNIDANVTIGDVDELAPLYELLRRAATPLAVSEVASRLGWDSMKTANALERGGNLGHLQFSMDGSVTKVALQG